jgi:hypothetical protein
MIIQTPPDLIIPCIITYVVIYTPYLTVQHKVHSIGLNTDILNVTNVEDMVISHQIAIKSVRSATISTTILCASTPH